jgi:hypothetical protein
MHHTDAAIPERDIPRAHTPLLQHLVDTYASEANKVVSVWSAFGDGDRGFRPHDRSSTVEDVFKHQLLSERRFFGEWLAMPEPAPQAIAPSAPTAKGYCDRLAYLDLLAARAAYGASSYAIDGVSAPARKTGAPVYGPTADVSWSSADPTNSVEASDRK